MENFESGFEKPKNDPENKPGKPEKNVKLTKKEIPELGSNQVNSLEDVKRYLGNQPKESLSPQDREFYEKFKYSVPRKIEDDFGNIQFEKGLEISQKEAAAVSKFFYSSVFFKEGKPSIPPKDDQKYHLLQIDYHDERMANLIGQMNAIFEDRKSGKIPDYIFIQTEDDKENPTGISKYAYQDFVSLIIPYILRKGLGTYIVTDGKSATTTFLDNGIAYWNRHEKIVRQPSPASGES